MAEQTAQPEVDLYDIPEEEFLQRMETARTAEQARDERGRFVSQQTDEPAVEESAEAQPDEVDEVVYRKVIDLGDGGGTQVFEAPSMEDLIEKLSTAQEHATRKIRELSAAQKAKEPAEPVVSADEDWLLSQELMSTPSKAFGKLLEKTVGTSVDEFKNDIQEVKALRREKRERTAASDFMKSHPDYTPTAYNGKLIEDYLGALNMEGTVENIEKAFTVLSSGGLLQDKAEDTQDTEQTNGTPTKQRIAAPAGVRTVVIQKKAASGLSAKKSVAAPVPTTEKDLYDMPYNEFLKLGGQSAQDNW